MSLDDQTRDMIAGILRDNPVILFMKGNRASPQCGFSGKTAAALDMLLPDYPTIDVLQNPEVREGIKQYGNWPTIPQLYVNGELVGGCDIVQSMYASGELASLLGVAPAGSDRPEVVVEPAAADVMANALKDHPGKVVQLRIDAGWTHTLSLDDPRDDFIDIDSSGLRLQADRWSAARANGLRIAFVESLQGTGFRFDNPGAPPPVGSLSCAELKAALDEGQALRIIDVRGDDECARGMISGAVQLTDETRRLIDSLPKDAPLVFHCHKGGRGRAAAEHYRRRGHTRVWNLDGGIDAWACEIDPALPRY